MNTAGHLCNPNWSFTNACVVVWGAVCQGISWWLVSLLSMRNVYFHWLFTWGVILTSWLKMTPMLLTCWVIFIFTFPIIMESRGILTSWCLVPMKRFYHHNLVEKLIYQSSFFFLERGRILNLFLLLPIIGMPSSSVCFTYFYLLQFIFSGLEIF